MHRMTFEEAKVWRRVLSASPFGVRVRVFDYVEMEVF